MFQNTYSNFTTDYDWLNVFKGEVYLGDEFSRYQAFDGSISCVQFFNYALDPATMSMKKHCQDIPEDKVSKPCPENYEFYDNTCYKISDMEEKFSKAEFRCLPQKDDAYETHLMSSDHPRHWAYVSKLVKSKLEVDNFWAGFSDQAVNGNATTNKGLEFTIESDDPTETHIKNIIDPAFNTFPCGLAGNDLM